MEVTASHKERDELKDCRRACSTSPGAGKDTDTYTRTPVVLSGAVAIAVGHRKRLTSIGVRGLTLWLLGLGYCR